MNIQQLSEKLKSKFFAGAAIDSRHLKAGEVFFALSGERVDGHSFLFEISQKKAKAAVVSKEYQGPDFGLDLVYVENVLETLQKLAQEIFAERATQVIAVTGSVGKTTTKEFIATLLEEKFRIGKTPGTYNSQATLPLCILNATGEEKLFVMEMGMSLPGEITRLVQIAPPDIAFVGRLALAHAAFFPEGLEGIARAKAEILSHPKTQLAILNSDTRQFQAFQSLGIPQVALFGDQEYQLVVSEKGWRIMEKGILSPEMTLPFEASHLRENFLGATVVARKLGMSWEEIFFQIPKLKLIPRRFERVERDGVVFINDSYNANPTSMRAAFENLPVAQEGRRIGILGEMRELGAFSEISHREIGELALDYFDQLLCFGRESAPLAEAFAKSGRSVQLFEEIAPLKEEMLRVVKPGDVVLIKGSNSKCMWTLLE
jgi:UDP-N-acetylmuramoyl-tripeptide--D-alanyl-D-alanine ligase